MSDRWDADRLSIHELTLSDFCARVLTAYVDSSGSMASTPRLPSTERNQGERADDWDA